MTAGLTDAVRRIIDWRLVSERDVVRGELRVSWSSSRNANLRVERRRAPGYLVKRADLSSPGVSDSVRSEALFYRFCSKDPRAAPVAAFMPTIAGIFDEGNALAIELVESGRSLWREYRERLPDTLSLNVPRELGTALGTLHSTFGDPALQADLPPPIRHGTPPGYFDLHRPKPAILREASPGRLDLVRCLQEEEIVGRGLETGRSAWRLETLIHGDIRSENLLVRPDPELGSPRAVLVDWEFVQLGDPAWDLAAAFEDHARFWLESMSQQPDLAAELRVATATCPLEALHPALDSLWSGYLSAAQLSGLEATDLLQRAVLFSGTRMIQTAWEHCRHLESLSVLSVMLVQLSANVFADPVKASRELYGLEASS